jgi:hypothetical protein
MPSIRHILSVALLCALPALAMAQQGPQATDQRPIEQRMSPEQFRAAGLDKLSPDELAALNAWLRGTLQAETARAAAEAEQKVKDVNRGFFDFGSADPIVARMVGEFRGFGKGQRYTLDNGQVWEQSEQARLSGIKLANPEVVITPGALGVWWMKVGNYNTRAKVRRIK